MEEKVFVFIVCNICKLIFLVVKALTWEKLLSVQVGLLLLLLLLSCHMAAPHEHGVAGPPPRLHRLNSHLGGHHCLVITVTSSHG
jgi:hypothetical protein